jgi:hypothetical protein
MLENLPKRGKVNTTDLITAYWKGRQPPFNARVAALDSLRSLKRKVSFNSEPFEIKTSGPAGGRPMDVWIERRR